MLFIYPAAATAGDECGFILSGASFVSSGALFLCQEHDK